MAEEDEGIYHDEVEIEDFEYDPETETFTYPCPCGDLFSITKDDLLNGEIIASCLSCSLVLKVIYEVDDIEDIIKSKEKQASKAPDKLTN